MRLQKYDVARIQFERLLEMGYRPSRMHFGLGQIAEAAGDAQQASAEYRRALQFEPGFQEAAAALSRLGKQEE
jgi:Tfp pilus assembly protein PilF